MNKWFAFLILLLFSAPVDAHEWYPWECCSGHDCAPVQQVDNRSLDLVVTSKHGSVAVPASFPRRESKDNRMHVCMRPVDGQMTLICLFMPPAM
jgi:hypothetical protein